MYLPLLLDLFIAFKRINPFKEFVFFHPQRCIMFSAHLFIRLPWSLVQKALVISDWFSTRFLHFLVKDTFSASEHPFSPYLKMYTQDHFLRFHCLVVGISNVLVLQNTDSYSTIILLLSGYQYTAGAKHLIIFLAFIHHYQHSKCKTWPTHSTGPFYT